LRTILLSAPQRGAFTGRRARYVEPAQSGTTHAPSPRHTGETPPDHHRQWQKRARLSRLLVALMWLSAVVAAALTLSSSTFTEPLNFATITTNLGIVAGLIAMDLILVMLVLAARIPLVDRSVGHDRAIAVHRSMGKPALYLLLAHAALLLVGYGASQGIDPIAEIGWIWSIPDMPLAFFGVGAIVAVVVTSAFSLRRKFSYEGWHLIHLLSYLGVLAAVPHQLSVGGILAESTFARAYWTSLFVLAFGAVIIYRFIEPFVVSLRHRLTVVGVEKIAPGVTSLHLRGHNLAALGATGGQYFVWRFWTAKTWWHAHPISLSAHATGDSARITVRSLGEGSRDISAVPKGTRVSLEGPYGIFTERGRTSPRLAIAAAGIGVTPVLALLQQANIAPGEATVVLRGSTLHDQALWDETIDTAQQKGANVYTMVGPRATVGASWISEADARRGVTLASVFPQLATSDLYLCGPTAWINSLAEDAKALGLAPHQIHTERFDW